MGVEDRDVVETVENTSRRGCRLAESGSGVGRFPPGSEGMQVATAAAMVALGIFIVMCVSVMWGRHVRGRDPVRRFTRAVETMRTIVSHPTTDR
jgi:hypothetical protein